MADKNWCFQQPHLTGKWKFILSALKAAMPIVMIHESRKGWLIRLVFSTAPFNWKMEIYSVGIESRNADRIN